MKNTLSGSLNIQLNKEVMNMSALSMVNLKDIVPFKNHPFQVKQDTAMLELMTSIKENGLLVPLVVRKITDEKYELISGHRRKMALEMLGINKIEVDVREFTDNEAIIYMVDSNIYRDKILPSEKAFAYKMKFDAMKHQGKLTSVPGEPKLSVGKIGNISGDSAATVKRYIRLTYLIPEILELVDNSVKYDKKLYLTMGIKPAVEISYLSKDEQNLLYSTITYNDLTPNHARTIKIRELSKAKQLDFNSLEKIMSQKKGNQNEQISFNKEKIEAVLPNKLLQRDKRYIEQYIIQAIIKYNELKKVEDDFIDINRLKI